MVSGSQSIGTVSKYILRKYVLDRPVYAWVEECESEMGASILAVLDTWQCCSVYC